MAGGRPSKYDPKYCESVVEHCRTGRSFESFAALVGISRQTVYAWAEEHEEFADAKRRAADLRLAWWEDLIRAGASGAIDGYHGTSAIFVLKNLGYRDEQQIESKSSVSMDLSGLSTDELMTIKSLLDKVKT